MMSEIKPALTAEEWALRLSGDYSGPREAGMVVIAGGSVAVTYDGGLAAASTGDNHVLAALALYGQPFGFTREDVRLLRDVAETHAAESGEDWHEDVAPINGLADRIEALLPPEA